MTEARRQAVGCRGVWRASLALVILACFALAGIEGALAADDRPSALPQAVLLDGDGFDSDQLKGLHPPASQSQALARSAPSVQLPSPASRLVSVSLPAAACRVLPSPSSLRGPPFS